MCPGFISCWVSDNVTKPQHLGMKKELNYCSNFTNLAYHQKMKEGEKWPLLKVAIYFLHLRPQFWLGRFNRIYFLSINWRDFTFRRMLSNKFRPIESMLHTTCNDVQIPHQILDLRLNHSDCNKRDCIRKRCLLGRLILSFMAWTRPACPSLKSRGQQLTKTGKKEKHKYLLVLFLDNKH